MFVLDSVHVSQISLLLQLSAADPSQNSQATKALLTNEPVAASSTLLVDLFHSQTKQIVSAVLALTRQHDIDNDASAGPNRNRPLSPLDDKEQMQLVKNIAIAVRDLLQTLDYAPTAIKEMVKNWILL